MRKNDIIILGTFLKGSIGENDMDLLYNRKFFRNWFVRKAIRISRKAVDIRDSFTDKRICGVSLTKYVPSIAEGSTGSQSCPYYALEVVYKTADFDTDDSFIDVGCGRGRVLAFLLREKCRWKLSGVEFNEEVAAYAEAWTKKYPDIEVICGDAFKLDYNNYTVIHLSRPFQPELFYKFIDLLESTLTHPVKLYYWVDQQSGDYLNDRKGWEMHVRNKLFFRKGFFVAMTPQRYSVWTYTP